MKLIVGLGNPGPEYIKTRHNAGFMLVEKLANRHNLSGAKHKFHAGILDGELHVGSPMRPERCILMQPTTYMNRSGLAVGEAVTFYKLDPETDLIVLVDDLALDVGTIRLRGEGSAGGQNGLADIITRLPVPARISCVLGQQGSSTATDLPGPMRTWKITSRASRAPEVMTTCSGVQER